MSDTIAVSYPWSHPLDAGQAIQGALNGRHRTVRVPFVGPDWDVCPLNIPSAKTLVLDPGVVLMARIGDYQQIDDCVLNILDASDVRIVAHGATARMRQDDYRNAPYISGEYRHGFRIWGGSNVNVAGLRTERTGGDGFYVGPSRLANAGRRPSRNVRLTDCTFAHSWRTGGCVMSCEGFRGLRLRAVGTANPTGVPTKAGFLVEPSQAVDWASDIHFDGCTAEDGKGPGFMVQASHLSGPTPTFPGSPPMRVTVRNGLVRDCLYGIRACLNVDRGAMGVVTFDGVNVVDTDQPGLWVIGHTDSPMRWRFTNVRMANVGRARGEAGIALSLGGHNLGVAPLFFDGCTVTLRPGQVPVRLDGNTSPGVGGLSRPVGNVTGNIEVFGGGEDVQPVADLPNLNVFAARGG